LTRMNTKDRPLDDSRSFLEIQVPDVRDFGLSPRKLALKLSPAEHFSAVAACSLRLGGFSSRPFDSLNFSASEGDSQENVSRNLEILCADLDVPTSSVVTMNQVHGDNVGIIDSMPQSEPVADAMITSLAGVFLGVRTADCAAILILDPINRVSAAIHAGWKGAVLKIAATVIDTMKRSFCSDPAKILAAIGPCVGSCCYEVDEKVLTPFKTSFSNADRFIHRMPQRNGKKSQSYGLDILSANRSVLMEEGVRPEGIFQVGLCTSCNESLFFSHRRDRGKSGRHLALVGFRADG
jgi:polyphenol oxidase